MPRHQRISHFIQYNLIDLSLKLALDECIQQAHEIRSINSLSLIRATRIPFTPNLEISNKMN